MRSYIAGMAMLPDAKAIFKTFYGKPIPAPRMTQSSKWKEEPQVQRYFGYKSDMRILFEHPECAVDNTHPWATAMGIEICAHFFTPKRSLHGKPHETTPDGDNLLKAVADSLVQNDGSVSIWLITKVWDEKDFVEIGLWVAK